MKSEPLVSVVIPFYSGIKWLDEALQSVLNQTYTQYEVLVINDGSKENISNIEEKYEGKVNFIHKENGGPATARNRGIQEAKGKYIAFLDSDDMWLPEKLEKQVELMEEKNAVWSQHSFEMFWDEKTKKKTVNTSKYRGNVYKDCYISFKIQTSCVMVKRDNIIKDEIIFPIDKRYGQDSSFYKQLAKKYEMFYLNGVYSKFRVRQNNAGFRAIVQINDRSSTWEEITNSKELKEMLPKSVLVAYKICYKESELIKRKNIKNEKFAKVLYLIPWLIFKLNVRK